MYLLVNSTLESNEQAIFPGSTNTKKFRDLLTTALKSLSVDVDNKDLAVHSFRKGSTTFATSGSVACPSIITVCRRAGWDIGGTLSRYLKAEGAGDQYLGRILAGLPLNDPHFALLPPHFVFGDEFRMSDLQTLLANHFSGIYGRFASLRSTLAYCLASLVWHSDEILKDCHRNHKIYHCSLFQNREQLDWLKKHIKCGLCSSNYGALVDPQSRFESCEMLATGVPPHIEVILEMRQLRRLVVEMANSQKSIGETVGNLSGELKGVLQSTIREMSIQNDPTNMNMAVVQNLLDNHAKSNQEVCNRQLEDSQKLHNALEYAVAQFQQKVVQESATIQLRSDTNSTVAVVRNLGSESTHYVWHSDTSLHRVEPGFSLPRMDPRNAWRAWWTGTKEIPPVHGLTANDFKQSPKKELVMFCRWKKVFTHMATLMPETMRHLEPETLRKCSDEDLNNAYDHAFKRLNISQATPKGRKRTRTQLSISSLYELLRKVNFTLAPADDVAPAPAPVDDSHNNPYERTRNTHRSGRKRTRTN